MTRGHPKRSRACYVVCRTVGSEAFRLVERYARRSELDECECGSGPARRLDSWPRPPTWCALPVGGGAWPAARCREKSDPIRAPIGMSQPSGADTLVVLIGMLRGGEPSWRSLERNLLRPNAAHLALMVAPGVKKTHLHHIAMHIWETREFSDWSLAVDGVAADLGLPNRTAWRKYLRPSDHLCCKKDRRCCMRPEFFGPRSWSGSINMVMRWQLKQRLITDKLMARYARFVITRSDQYYGCALSLASLDLHHIWAPEGEDYGGITDRFIVCSRADVLGCVSVIDGFLRTPDAYDPTMNPESYFRQRLIEQSLWPRVRRFPRVMFTAAVAGDKSRWQAASRWVDPVYHVHVKYERAYIRTLWACGHCNPDRGAEPFCCSHLNYAWALALADRITGERIMGTQAWDDDGHCQTLGVWWVALCSAAAVLLCVVYQCGRTSRRWVSIPLPNPWMCVPCAPA